MTNIQQHVLTANAATQGVRRTDGAIAELSIHDFVCSIINDSSNLYPKIKA
jgi:hypothetical protein